MLSEPLHHPRLDTILNVESFIKKSKEPLSKNEIDRWLKKQIMRHTLNLILVYLEDSGKIALLKERIMWIHREDSSRKLKDKFKRGVAVI